MNDYHTEKRLENGGILRMHSWISDTLAPGRRMYILELAVPGNSKVCMPSDFDKHSARVPDWYRQIKTVDDFAGILAEVEHTSAESLLKLLE